MFGIFGKLFGLPWADYDRDGKVDPLEAAMFLDEMEAEDRAIASRTARRASVLDDEDEEEDDGGDED